MYYYEYCNPSILVQIFISILYGPLQYVMVVIYFEGKHVMCEKPLTLSVSETKDCYELAKKQKKILFCAYNRYSSLII